MKSLDSAIIEIIIEKRDISGNSRSRHSWPLVFYERVFMTGLGKRKLFAWVKVTSAIIDIIRVKYKFWKSLQPRGVHTFSFGTLQV